MYLDELENEVYEYVQKRVRELIGDAELILMKNDYLESSKIGVSSYDMVQLFMDIEKAYSIRIPDNMLFMDKVDDIVTGVHKLVEQSEEYKRKILKTQELLFGD